MTADRADAAYLRYHRARFALEVFIAVVVVAALSLLVWNSTTARASRGELVSLSRVIYECTTPPELRTHPKEPNPPASDCYVRSQKSQASIIGDPPAPINNVVILASYCARIPANSTETKVRTCVLKGLR